MSRSITYSALTLRLKSSGESNREAWFLTAEEGLVKATVFGGPKSRLRSSVAPFHEGKLLVYHDPVRDSRKVTDFDVHTYRIGIRELYERAMTAGAVAETILSSHGGGGNWQETIKLAGRGLDALDGADAAACTLIGVYFLWHWGRFLGMGQELGACSSCACEVKRDEVLWYSIRKEAFFCEKCMRLRRGGPEADSSFRIGPAARKLLGEIESLDPAALGAAKADQLSGGEFRDGTSKDGTFLEQAKALSKAVLAAALGKRLPSWDVI